MCVGNVLWLTGGIRACHAEPKYARKGIWKADPEEIRI